MTDRDADLEVIDLAASSERQLSALGNLRVSERQEVFGGSFAETLEAWRTGPPQQVLGLGFIHADAPVGAVLFKRSPRSPAWAPADAATIHGLKIASPWQGRGWGHLAFRMAVERLKQEWPTAGRLMLAVDADNHAAIAVYRVAGMADSGPVFEGRIGLEHRMEMPLGR